MIDDANSLVRPASLNRKISGIMVPLFSIRTEENWGSGEILDLIPFIDWMADHHLHLLQMLPLYETAPRETSPYQALSGFALDPIFLSLHDWEDFKKSAAAQKKVSSPSVRKALKEWRASGEVRFESIRALKYRLQRLAFEHFKQNEWEQESDRAKSLQAFMDEKSDWLDDYALFRLLKEKYEWRYWIEWPLPFRNRESQALEAMKREEADQLLFIKYLQWALWEQWERAHEHARRKNVLLMGDLPFLVSRDSADVWSHQDLFGEEDSVGAPPDAFSETGQDWGLPLFLWKEMEKKDFFWWRMRIREVRQLYDMIRLDHVVGFYRVWVVPKKGKPRFEPSGEAEQVSRGKALLAAIVEASGTCIPIAEDLGVIPKFVYQTLGELGIAGHKVLRWQKEGLLFHDPKEYPFISLATTGTHDTSALATWWNEIPFDERKAFLEMVDEESRLSPEDPFSEPLHQKILDRLMGSGSGLVIFPIQDVFGSTDQINVPATVGSHNWRYRLPVTVSELSRASPYREKMEFLKQLIDLHRRHAGSTSPVTVRNLLFSPGYPS
jgi:4-alpha-glucanotransferase